MTTEKGRKHLPPYVSYRTFRNFLDRLQQHMPARIDRSYWSEILSGSTGTQLMAALRFLGLIDINGKPTDPIKEIVAAHGESRVRILRAITTQSYGFILKNNLDLESATYSQLEEGFHNSFQLTDDVRRKCIKFFIGLSMDAGVPISPFITRRTRNSSTTPGTKTAARKAVIRTKRNGIIPQAMVDRTENGLWNSKLLDKFPNFDPAWSEELKAKWFAAFDELLKRGTNRE